MPFSLREAPTDYTLAEMFDDLEQVLLPLKCLYDLTQEAGLTPSPSQTSVTIVIEFSSTLFILDSCGNGSR